MRPSPFSMFLPVNGLAVLVAAIAAFVFGFLVHGPIFGQTWIKLMKMTPAEMEAGKAEMQKKMPMYMLAALVQQLVVACVLAYLLLLTGVTTVSAALALVFWLWLGFIAMVLLNGVLWEKRTVALYSFNVAYHLASLAIMAVIITLLS